MTAYTLKLILMAMKSGHTELHEVKLVKPEKKEESYIAHLSHRLFHRIAAHFGTGPFTTSFTLAHGPYMLHGHIKTNMELSIPVMFTEVEE